MKDWKTINFPFKKANMDNISSEKGKLIWAEYNRVMDSFFLFLSAFDLEELTKDEQNIVTTFECSNERFYRKFMENMAIRKNDEYLFRLLKNNGERCFYKDILDLNEENSLFEKIPLADEKEKTFLELFKTILKLIDVLGFEVAIEYEASKYTKGVDEDGIEYDFQKSLRNDGFGNTKSGSIGASILYDMLHVTDIPYRAIKHIITNTPKI